MATKGKKTRDAKSGKSRTKPKPKPRAAAPVSDEEAERMFHYWRSAEGEHSVLNVSRKFGRSRTTVARAKNKGFKQPKGKKLSWEERDAQIREQVRKQLDKKKAKHEASNIELVRGLRNVAYKGLFKTEQGKTVLRETPSLNAVTRLIELDHEMSAGLPPGETAGGSGGISEESLQQAIVYLDLLKKMDPGIIKAIGDFAAGKDLPCFEYEQSEDKDSEE